MKEEFEKYPDVNFTFNNANNDIRKQTIDMKKFIKQKVDLLIVNPINQKALKPLFKKAKRYNITFNLIVT